MFQEADFKPPMGLHNGHVQTILGSSRLRDRRVNAASGGFRAASIEEILDCGEGVRLHGLYTPVPGSERLVILIHGWHGHADSAYLLSCANHLWQQGFSVFRLHLRDHGPSHHLNRDLFHSVRIAEVVNAVAEIRRQHPHKRLFLGGFSLGGNFALRVALRSTAHELGLEKVFAVCPVLDPASAMDALSESQIYHRYFTRKWRNALLAKLEHFPEYDFAGSLQAMRSMREMNEFFIPRYTGFGDTHSYLAAYALTGTTMAPLDVPCHIIAADDDPVIPADDLLLLAPSPALAVERSKFGGHCAFLNSWKLDNWIDQRVASLLA